ncbi:ParA family protein [Streptosporangium canum]|uniref:ParA family protein n=1 Tax=Streptosporangium canum TaxID=324952 RepID=UPI003680C622
MRDQEDYRAGMQITAVVNQKGGVGKTTTTINLGGALAEQGQRVLLVDLDPQGHLTEALKLPEALDGRSLAGILTGAWTGAVDEIVVPYSTPGTGRLDVIPTTLEMFTVGRELDRLRAREERLGRILAPLDDLYDHCLIDCPPALDILTDNALTAADGVLIPVQAEDSTLRALRLLLAQIDALEAELRRTPLVLHGMVVSMLDRGAGGQARSNIGRSVITALEGLPLPIVATIPRGVPISEAWRYGRTVTDYAPDSEHAAEFRALAQVLAKAAAA